MRRIKKAFYFSLRFTVKAGLYFYFSKIKVSGIEKIPKDVPVIFGANHENAFMDALLIATHTTKYCHYLVRADIFKIGWVKTLLSWINMMPIYRIRDGFRTLKSNQDVFINCYKILHKGESIIMFPEGNHNIRRVERRITKGISKIALGAVHSSEYPSHPVIIPVGLNYSCHRSFRSTVHIVFGHPLKTETEESTSTNQQNLRNIINEELNNCHIRLPNTMYAFAYALWIQMKSGVNFDHPHVTNAEIRKIINAFDDSDKKKYNDIAGKFLGYLDAYGVSYFQLHQNPVWNIIQMILLLPLALLGLVNHIVPLTILQWIVHFKIKDHIFDSSIKFSIGYFLIVTNYILLMLYLSDVLGALWMMAYLISLPMSLSLIHI